MLIYHPAFDMHHCIFRILRLLTNMPVESYEVDKVRILDFYLLFPEYIQQVIFPKEGVRFKKLLPQTINPYDKLENPRRILARLEPFQSLALNCLASYGLIDAILLAQGEVRKTQKQIPQELALAIDEANVRDNAVIGFLTGPFAQLGLYGPKGLKYRSFLLEYRYDPV